MGREKLFKIENALAINGYRGMYCHEPRLTCRYPLTRLTGSRKMLADGSVMDPK